MNGQQLEACFGTGFSGVSTIRVANQALSVPSTNVTSFDADVQEQCHAVTETFNSGTLSITPDANGDGLWIPWLGQGSASSNGKGWGTYTSDVGNASWVATGPFSGCYAVGVTGGGSTRFAHIVTAGSGYTVASVDDQIQAVKTATGLTTAKKIDMTGSGEGFVFFMLLGGVWKYRRVFAAPGSGSVVQASASPTNVF
jgi:hypothetical protein